MASSRSPTSIDEYIQQFSPEVQVILSNIRSTISIAAPDAEEVISYQMPAFRQHGILLYFAAWKEHIGVYPPITGDAVLEKALARYTGPKGNFQFPLTKPIPLNLIKRIVKLRVKQNVEKAEAKRAQRKQRR